MQMRQGSFSFKAKKNMCILAFGISATDTDALLSTYLIEIAVYQIDSMLPCVFSVIDHR